MKMNNKEIEEMARCNGYIDGYKRGINQACKETAREIINEIKAFIYNDDNLMERINIIAKQYGVDVAE